jgi:TolA-binding protein
VPALKEILKDNWHLMALLVGVLAAGVLLQQYKGASAATPNAGTVEAVSKGAADVEAPERPSSQDEARTIIAKHKARFDQNPSDKEAPALLNAMGNLYRRQLVDYPNAIQCYELLLHDYPKCEEARNAIISLADCYRRQGDREGARRTYERMTQFFPPESQEYQYAKAELSR